MIFDGYVNQLPDSDPGETTEWLDSLDAVIDISGKPRARYLLSKLLERARASQVSLGRLSPTVSALPGQYSSIGRDESLRNRQPPRTASERGTCTASPLRTVPG